MTNINDWLRANPVGAQTEDDEEDRPTLESTALNAPDLSPDDVGAQRRVALEAGVSPVLGADPLTQRAADARRLRELETTNPRLAAWMTQPDNYAVARDDADNLSIFERLAQDITTGNIYRRMGPSGDILAAATLPVNPLGAGGYIASRYRNGPRGDPLGNEQGRQGALDVEQQRLTYRRAEMEHDGLALSEEDARRLTELRTREGADDWGAFVIGPTRRMFPQVVEGVLRAGREAPQGFVEGYESVAGTESQRRARARARLSGQLEIGPVENMALNLRDLTLGGAAGVTGFIGRGAGGYLASVYEAETGGLYDQLREQGVDADIAYRASTQYGAWAVSLEFILDATGLRAAGVTRLVARTLLRESAANALVRAPATRVLTSIGGASAAQATEEATQRLAEIIHEDLASQESQGAGRDVGAAWREAMTPENIRSILDSGWIGSQGGAGMATGPALANLALDVRAAQQAERYAAVNEGRIRAAQGSRLTERGLASTLESAIGAMDESHTYIDADRWVEHFQGADAYAVAEELGVGEQQLATALSSHGAIEMPTARLHARVLSNPAHAALAEHTRSSPTADTPAEAKMAGERIQAEIERMVEETKGLQTDNDLGAFVEDKLRELFTAAEQEGGYRPEVSRRYAQVAAALPRTMVARARAIDAAYADKLEQQFRRLFGDNFDIAGPGRDGGFEGATQLDQRGAGPDAAPVRNEPYNPPEGVRMSERMRKIVEMAVNGASNEWIADEMSTEERVVTPQNVMVTLSQAKGKLKGAAPWEAAPTGNRPGMHGGEQAHTLDEIIALYDKLSAAGYRNSQGASGHDGETINQIIARRFGMRPNAVASRLSKHRAAQLAAEREAIADPEPQTAVALRRQWVDTQVVRNVVPGGEPGDYHYGFVLSSGRQMYVGIADDGNGAATIDWSFLDRLKNNTDEDPAALYGDGNEKISASEWREIRIAIRAIFEADMADHERPAYMFTPQRESNRRSNMTMIAEMGEGLGYDLLEDQGSVYLLRADASIAANGRIKPQPGWAPKFEEPQEYGSQEEADDAQNAFYASVAEAEVSTDGPSLSDIARATRQERREAEKSRAAPADDAGGASRGAGGELEQRGRRLSWDLDAVLRLVETQGLTVSKAAVKLGLDHNLVAGAVRRMVARGELQLPESAVGYSRLRGITGKFPYSEADVVNAAIERDEHGRLLSFERIAAELFPDGAARADNTIRLQVGRLYEELSAAGEDAAAFDRLVARLNVTRDVLEAFRDAKGEVRARAPSLAAEALRLARGGNEKLRATLIAYAEEHGITYSASVLNSTISTARARARDEMSSGTKGETKADLNVRRTGTGGELNQSVDPSLSAAEEMDALGYTEDEIWLETGALRDEAGGAWRFDQAGEVGQTGARGSIRYENFKPGEFGSAMIRMGKSSDLSTFLHEFGHLGHLVLESMATDEAAPAEFKAMWANTLQWWGIDQEQWSALSNEQKTPYFEQWARTFEAYLMEGKAPSLSLREAFAAFKAWLLQIYRSVFRIDAKLNPQIRDVFDRMLATDAEMAEARAAMGSDFTLAREAFKTDEEYQSYVEAIATARDAQDAELRARVMDKFVRKEKRWWRTERERVRTTAEIEVDSDPARRAFEWIAFNEWRALPVEQNEEGVELPADASLAMPEDLPEMRLDMSTIDEADRAGLPEGLQPLATAEDAQAALDNAMALKRQGRARQPQRLWSFIKAQGGIKDEGGEVTQALGSVRSRPGLINNTNGLSADELALRAWEAGYFGAVPRQSELRQDGPDAGSGGAGQNWVDLYTGMRGDTNRPWRGHEWTVRDQNVAREYGPNVRQQQGDISDAVTIRTQDDLRRALGARADELMTPYRGEIFDYLDNPAVRAELRARGVGVVRFPDDSMPHAGAGNRWHESYLILDEGRLRNAPGSGGVGQLSYVAQLQEQGFDTSRRWYRGDAETLEGPLRPAKLGGLWFTSEPSNAASYAGDIGEEFAARLRRSRFPDGANMMSAYIRGRIVQVPDGIIGEQLDAFVAQAWRDGADAVELPAAIGPEGSRNIIVRDPANNVAAGFGRPSQSPDGGEWHTRAWHGSHEASGPIEIFDMSRAGTGSGAGTGERAAFFTLERRLAEAFGPAHEYEIRGRLFEYNANGQSYKHIPVEEILERARRDGYAGVRFRRPWETHQYVGDPRHDRLNDVRFSDQIAIFDPADIRPVRTPDAPNAGAAEGSFEIFQGEATPDEPLIAVHNTTDIRTYPNGNAAARQRALMEVRPSELFQPGDEIDPTRRPTPRELLDALIDDIKNVRQVYSSKDEAAVAAYQNRADALRWFEARDIDLSGTKEEIRSQIVDALNREAEQENGGWSLDDAAPWFGFSSGDELLQALKSLKPRAVAIEENIDARLEGQYGDPLNDGTVAEAAALAGHIEAQSKRIEIELEAIQRATGGKATPVGRAARAYAERQVQHMTVKQIRGFETFLAGERRAARAAMEATEKKDFSTAAIQKSRQIVSFWLYRLARDAAEEMEGAQRYFQKFSREGVRKKFGTGGAPHLEQIDQILEAIDLRRNPYPGARSRASFQEYMARLQEQGVDTDDIVQIDKDFLAAIQRRPFTALTLEEARGVRDAVQNFEVLGTRWNQVLTDRRNRQLNEVIDEMTEHAATEYPKRAAIVPSIASRSRFERATDLVMDLHGSMVKAEQMFRFMDGLIANGPWFSAFMPAAQRAESAKTARLVLETERFKELLAAYSRRDLGRMLTRKEYISAIGDSLTRLQQIGVLLYSGTEYRRNGLMKGFEWNEQQLQAVIDRLDERDVRFAQGVWNFLESFQAESFDLDYRVRGVRPQADPGIPVQTAFGVIQGKYFPIKFDPDHPRNNRAAKNQAREAVEQLSGGSYRQVGTKRGRLKQLVGTAGMAFRLDPISIISEHVEETVHDLTHREFVIDARRMIASDRVRNAVRSVMGRFAVKAMDAWIAKIEQPQPRVMDSWERLAGRVKNNATIVNMGLKITTALIQELGSLNAIPRTGIIPMLKQKGITVARDYPVFLARQTARLFGAPESLPARIQFIFDRSEFMRQRMGNWDRDARDAMASRLGERPGILPQVPKEVQDSMLILSGLMDMAVSAPAWLAGYESALGGKVKGIEQGDENASVEYADSIIRTTQSGGAPKDLSAILANDNQFWRLATMFFSWSSTYYNQMFVEQIPGVMAGKIPPARFAANMLFIWFLPALVTMWFYGHLEPQDGEDDDERNKRIAAEAALYPLQGIPIVRDGVNAYVTGYDYQFTPAQAAMEAPLRLMRAADRGDSEEVIKQTVMTAGYALGLPSRQMWITGEGLTDIATGEEDVSDDPLDSAREVLIRDTR